MRDLLNNSEQIMLLAAERRVGHNSGVTDPTLGTAVDLAGEGRKCLVMVSVGTTSTVTVALTIEESADDITYSALSDVIVLDNVEAQVVDLTPTMRYIRASAAFTQTSETGTYIDFGVGAIIYNERYRPSNVA